MFLQFIFIGEEKKTREEFSKECTRSQASG